MDNRTKAAPSASLSRRKFVELCGLGMAGIIASSAIAPKQAEALTGNASDPDQLWNQALIKAEFQGAEVHENITPHQNPVPRSSITATAQGSTTVGVVPDTITAVAIFEASGNQITTLYDAWVYGTQSSVANSYYSYVILDGGRTIAVKHTATLQNIFGISQGFKIYSEYYYTGTGWLSISYL